MAVDSKKVKELRSLTNCGIVDCKQALEESKGDIEKAVDWLRRKGKASAAKKSTRTTSEGVVASYIHTNNKLGVLVVMRCETDFVARTATFQGLAKNIALHVAAASPVSVRPEDIPSQLVERESAIAKEQATASGKPEAIQQKMIEGKINRFRQEQALLSQPYVKDPSKTVADIINEAISEVGENISVEKFSRLAIE